MSVVISNIDKIKNKIEIVDNITISDVYLENAFIAKNDCNIEIDIKDTNFEFIYLFVGFTNDDVKMEGIFQIFLDGELVF